MPASTAPVTVGVDTHLDLHVAAVLDQNEQGAGTYGAGLTRSVHAYGLEAVEVNRLDRSLRRYGKSGQIDAQAAARGDPGWGGCHRAKTREGRSR
jgi:hypothetical protein